jgi:hypothetical protein
MVYHGWSTLPLAAQPRRAGTPLAAWLRKRVRVRVRVTVTVRVRVTVTVTVRVTVGVGVGVRLRFTVRFGGWG